MLQSSCQPASDVPAVPAEATPVYRFWSPTYGRHLYTLDEAERDELLAHYPRIWTCEGPVFRAFGSQRDERLAPVHHFWSGLLNTHFYTIDPKEAEGLIANHADAWTYEGVSFYAFPPSNGPAGTIRLCRFWSDSLGTHFYTTNDRERFSLVADHSDIWQDEGVACYVYPLADSCDIQIIKGPMLHWVTRDSVTIVWETDVPAESHLCYGVESPGACRIDDSESVTLHRVTLAGLASDTRYVYAAASGSAIREGSFVTAPAPDRAFRFAVCSDTQWDAQTHAQVARSILAGGPRVVFHAGDLVSAGRDWDTWGTEFFAPASELLANVPIIPIPGNHGYFGSEAPWFFYYFDRPVSQAWFTLTYGAVRFIGLDTSVPFTVGSPQYEWLLSELASSACRDALWRVAILHEPPFTSTTGHQDNTAVQENLVPLFERHGVDVVFSGHSHAYERYLWHGTCYIVTGGGGGPLYPLLPDTEPPFRQVGLCLHHYCSIDVDPALGTLTIAAIDTAGRVVDLVRLRK